MDGGKPFAEGVAEMVEKFPEYKEAIEIYHSRWVEMIGGEVEGTADLIRRLKAAGYGVYGLTNWSNETYPFIRDTYPIFSEFDGIVVSGDEKLLKPDPAIYDCLLGRYGLKAEESIFIDDNVANVAGAMVVGMYAIQFQDAKQVEDQLRLQFELEF
jgi:2-haloacid dehalogenase